MSSSPHYLSRTATADGAPRDLQEHIARLEAKGLLTRIEPPINNDTELHPLARWQFQGGLHENLPVLIAALQPRRRSTPPAWACRSSRSARPGRRVIAEPVPPVIVTQAPCQEVVISGDELKEKACRACRCRFPRPASTRRPI